MKFPIFLIAIALVGLPFAAQAISSASYQLFPEQGFLAPSADGSSTVSDKLESTSFQVQGSIESFAGSVTSTSFEEQGGGAFQYYCGDGFIDTGETCDSGDLNSATCVTQGFASGSLTCSATCTLVTSGCVAAAGGGGGSVSSGGGGGAVPAATLPTTPVVSSEIASLGFTYQSQFLVYGSQSASTSNLKINQSEVGVDMPTGTSWKKTVALAFGLNTFKIVASNASGSSDEAVYELYRRLAGDITQDNQVNDYDLSKLIKMWKGTNREGDFNIDGKVNDYDFSMMVARWGVKV